MKVTKTELEKRVARGVKFMDKEFGRSWLRRINMDQLDMHTSADCILGQLEGDYWGTCLENLGISYEDSVHLGFDLSWNDVSKDDQFDGLFNQLTKLWKKAVKAHK